MQYIYLDSKIKKFKGILDKLAENHKLTFTQSLSQPSNLKFIQSYTLTLLNLQDLKGVTDYYYYYY